MGSGEQRLVQPGQSPQIGRARILGKGLLGRTAPAFRFHELASMIKNILACYSDDFFT